MLPPLLSSLVITNSLNFDIRPRCSLRYCQIRCWYCQHGSTEARAYLQVHRTNYYGRYLGYLRIDRRRHLARKQYAYFVSNSFLMIRLVTGAITANNYPYSSGYKHLASGLVCGLSSLVHILSSNFSKGCWFRHRYRRRCWS